MERPQFSEMLAARRRELGYSIGQASRVLRLKENVLIAFEEGDFESMPKSGYAQGMLSSYARYLGLDATEICDVYLEDLESYRRGRKPMKQGRRGNAGADLARSQSPSVGQPYVPKRGLLPTSGGLAGDLGSFATTRVMSREQYPEDREGVDAERGAEYSEYPQGRPYTGRTPSRRVRERTTGRRSRNRGDVDTMSPNDYEYEDDLRFGRDVRSYEAASTGRGRRRPSRNGRQQRPSVRRQSRAGSSEHRRDGRRSSRDSRSGRRSGRGSQAPRPNRMLMLVIGAVVILTVVIVLTAVSCIRQGGDEGRTVPVSVADSSTQSSAQSSSDATQSEQGQTSSKDSSNGQDSSKESNNDSSKESSGGNSAHTGGASNSANTGKNNSTEKETSVSVSVNDGEVTWLEIACDGKSDVAETITGPWQKTYTVTDSMTIQAGETSSVAVVQNGRQLQFESITAGIGTLHIQGTKKPTSTDKNTNSSSKSEDANGSGKTGSAANSTDGEEGEDTSAYTTVDGVTYDSYGNVVSAGNEDDESTGSGVSANAKSGTTNAATATTSGARTSASRGTGR